MYGYDLFICARYIDATVIAVGGGLWYWILMKASQNRSDVGESLGTRIHT